MKRPIRWLIWLYPPAWRVRYHAELEALVEDAESGGADAFDVLKAAVKMRVLQSWSFAQLAVVLGVAGVLVVAATLATAQPTWVSQAELKMSSAKAAAGVNEELLARLQGLQQEILSRTHLSGVIQSLDLYPEERKSQPLEDVIEQMRGDLNLDVVATESGPGLKISYRYPDRLKAQATVGMLAEHFEKANMALQHQWFPPLAPPEFLDVLDPPSLPMRSQFGLRPFYSSSLETVALAVTFGSAGLVPGEGRPVSRPGHCAGGGRNCGGRWFWPDGACADFYSSAGLCVALGSGDDIYQNRGCRGIAGPGHGTILEIAKGSSKYREPFPYHSRSTAAALSTGEEFAPSG